MKEEEINLEENEFGLNYPVCNMGKRQESDNVHVKGSLSRRIHVL